MRRPYGLQAILHLLCVVLIATVSALGFASPASAVIGSASLVNPSGASSAHEGFASSCDGAPHSVAVHTSEAPLVASDEVSDGVQGTAVMTAGSSPW